MIDEMRDPRPPESSPEGGAMFDKCTCNPLHGHRDSARSVQQQP